MRSKQILIIDYGSGNLQSIVNALDYLNISNKITNNPKDIQFFDKVILPGVGSFDYAMKNLNQMSFAETIIDHIKSKKIILLGICLGMQLLYDFSEEDGGVKGLGLISGSVSKIKTNKDIRVPNIGWRKILHSNSSILLKGLEVDPIFYFVHSYACKTLDDQVVTGGLNYGNNFDVIIESENVFGTQFHPEKSQTAGLQILKNFSLLS